jgi:hypothetical protein
MPKKKDVCWGALGNAACPIRESCKLYQTACTTPGDATVYFSVFQPAGLGRDCPTYDPIHDPR